MARLIRDVLQGFSESDGFFLAAGLSFYVVICVVPFILLLIAGGGVLLADERVEDEVVTRLVEILPVYQEDVEQILGGVARAKGISGALGTVILIIFATQLFAATRLVLNRIFGMKGRTFLRGVFFDFVMILVLILLFFIAMAVTAAFAWLQSMLGQFGRGPVFAALVAWAGLFVAIVLNAILFGTVYRFVPIQRIPWSCLLTGSVTAAVLWEVAKQLFRLYIERVGVYSAVYGSLGVTIALIMWVYYSAVVFVVGANVIRVLDLRRGAQAAV
jgi:membrane protein